MAAKATNFLIRFLDWWLDRVEVTQEKLNEFLLKKNMEKIDKEEKKNGL